ncbi:uncharacterized protein LOC133372444 isoform X2 [Rhineura floridana]|nr:uncharacterized protein LOC133372444 isoform X2 [Rhineura floridana]XP_061457052.1 uncharacterized protein LOC133372444 isoform X2 [Rhineura floridana]
MASAKSPASPHQLKEFDNVRASLADIIGQLRDIDPSRLSFSPFLDLDTQICLAPVSDSPESSVEELHSTEGEEEKEEGAASANPLTGQAFPDPSSQTRHSLLQEAAWAPEVTDAPAEEAATVQDGGGGDTVAIQMPRETSFLDAVETLSRGPLPPAEPAGGGGQAGALAPADPLPAPCGQQPCLVLCHGSGDPAFCPDRRGGKCCQACSTGHMKAVASAFVSLLLAPWLLYGGYYFLPLQVPACPDLASRIAFALRCLLIAGVPILLGITSRAFSTLCLDTLGPVDPSSRPTLLHQIFTAGSVDQLVVFGLNVTATATFLPQEHLRLIPILVGLFSMGRYLYWASLHLCSTYRGFGFGLSFFPTLSLMAYNLFCLYHLGFGFLFAASPVGYAHATPAPTLGLTMPKR